MTPSRRRRLSLAVVALGALIPAGGCGARSANMTAAERSRALPLAAPLPSSSAGPATPAPLPSSPWPARSLYVRVKGQCTRWEIRDRVARYRRQTPRGDVVLEMTLDVPPDSTRVGPSRRVAPVDALRKRLDELACPQCVRDEEVQGGPPPTYSGCVSPMPARWYREEDECLRAAGPTGKPELDAATDPGHPVTDCVFNALTDEAVRQADLDDAAAYDETLRRVRAAEARADALLRAFASQIARTRQIFVREDGQSEGLCEVWSVRHDPGSPSGWISREERQDDGTRQVAEFRFAAQPYSVEMTGWKTTALPSSADVTSIADRGSLCTTLTTVVDVSAAQITFDDQTWYFSARACHAGAKTSRPDDGFGPRCHRSG